MASIGPRPPMPVETSAPALDRHLLRGALQRELKSVGCYHGEINGAVDRLNAPSHEDVHRSCQCETTRQRAGIKCPSPAEGTGISPVMNA